MKVRVIWLRRQCQAVILFRLGQFLHERINITQFGGKARQLRFDAIDALKSVAGLFVILLLYVEPPQMESCVQIIWL